jgi:hypothetical protein
MRDMMMHYGEVKHSQEKWKLVKEAKCVLDYLIASNIQWVPRILVAINCV